MDIRMSAIGWSEPTFLLSVLLGLLAAVAINEAITALGARIPSSRVRRILLPPVWVAAFLFLLIGPMILLQFLFSMAHTHAWACTVLVGWAFYLPPLLLAALTLGRALSHRRATKRADT